MPARQPSHDAVYELAEAVLGMDPAELARFASGLSPEDLDVLELAVGRAADIGWRANPAVFAHELSGGEFRLWPYFVLLGERFRLAFDGDDPHQIWNMPSQYGKTSSLMWGVLWALDRDPRLRIMYVSYDADKAVEEGGNTRDLAQTHAHRLRFRLRTDKRARGMWSTSAGGGLYCVGIHGGITGFPEDAVLADDLIKGWEAAHSEAQRDTAWNIYRSQIRMRLQSNRDPIIVAGTRWHEDDPSGRLVRQHESDPHADRFSLVRLPAIAEAPQPDAPDIILRSPDPLGRAPGEPLEPDRFPIEEVRARAAGLGSYLAAAMEQQRPAPEEGGEIKRAWWVWETQMPAGADEWVSSWDTKLKDKATGDYVVGQVWGRNGADFYCHDQMRGQYSQATTKLAVALMKVRWPQVNRHYVENTGNGPEVMEELRNPSPGYTVTDEMAGELGMTEAERAAVQRIMRSGLSGLIPVTVKGPKIVRARAVSGLIEARNVHLPEGAAFAMALVNEAAAFPNGAHDDMVDCMSQALAKLSRGQSSAKAPSRPRPTPTPGQGVAPVRRLNGAAVRTPVGRRR